MSRIPAALIVCGVCFAVQPSVVHAFSAETGGAFDHSRPVRLAVQIDKKFHDTPSSLPARNPGKLIVQNAAGSTKPRPSKKLSSGERDKQLCLALQACRNEFVRCKGKIKHPDQSQAWSIAKEECGARYKSCVEKDFKGGQWFFTRWFYFKELDCR